MSDQANLVLQYDYSANLQFQAQQRRSKLEFAVMRGTTDGEKKRHHLIGSVDPVQITSRHQATPYTPTPHDDRWTIQSRWVAADLFDKFDELRSAVGDVTSSYLAAQVSGMLRKKDAIILAAMGGSAVTGQTGTGTSALPSGSKVAVNQHMFDAASGTADVGLMLFKLEEALKKLEASYGGLEDKRVHCAAPSKQKFALMSDPRVISSLYRTNKPLDTNSLGTLLGVEFHIYADSLIVVDSNSDELVYLWVEDAVIADFPAENIQTRLTEMPGLNYSIQAWAAMQMGAVRLDNSGVIEIACDPTPVIVG